MTLSDWSPREWTKVEVLDGVHARLERLNWAEHGDGLFAAVCGDENNDLWRYMPIGPFLDRAVFQQIFEFARDKFGWETMVIRQAITGLFSVCPATCAFELSMAALRWVCRVGRI